MNIKWNARDYTDNFNFVPAYGSALIDMIKAEPNSKVLDLGCGSGYLTNELKNKGFNIIGIDDSEEMLEIAKRSYPDLIFKKGNALDFDLEETFDVVFSNAVFHWIDKEDQEKMIRQVAKALKPGGEFIFEMGGYGNNELIHKIFKDIFNKNNLDYEIPYYFPSIAEYASLLEENGFLVTDAFLFDRLTELKGDNGLYDWIKMFLRKPFEGMKESEEENFISEAVSQLKKDLYINGKWYSDYVRLRIRAIKK